MKTENKNAAKGLRPHNGIITEEAGFLETLSMVELENMKTMAEESLYSVRMKNKILKLKGNSMVYLAADLHFGHEAMAIKRGFSSAEEHDAFIIKSWNNVVPKRATVFLLGDLTMEKSSHYHKLGLLKGTLNVGLGNHDMPQHVPELLKHVNKVFGIIKYKQKEHNSSFLSHCPIHPIELDYRVKYNIHGHMHENSIEDPRYFCVSLEQIGYKPILYTDVIEILEKRNKKI